MTIMLTIALVQVYMQRQVDSQSKTQIGLCKVYGLFISNFPEGHDAQ